MKLIFFLLLSSSLFASLFASSATFKAPEGWRQVDERDLPKSVKFMAMGPTTTYFPPSINLGVDEHKGTLSDYLKIVKKINESHGTEWRDLGMIQTKAGSASLSELVMPTEWGEIRMMHVIYLKEGMAYILTAAAMKEEFSSLLPRFYEAFRSFDIADNLDIANKSFHQAN